jgi:hypothetical protein
MEGSKMNWAIECEGKTEYIKGYEAKTETEAEARWRELTGLHFLGVSVRRTTPDEDERLMRKDK